jgi:hypothetical protein
VPTAFCLTGGSRPLLAGERLFVLDQAVDGTGQAVAVGPTGAWTAGPLTFGRDPGDGSRHRIVALLVGGADAAVFGRELAAGTPLGDTALLRGLPLTGLLRPGGSITAVTAVEIVLDASLPPPASC